MSRAGSPVGAHGSSVRAVASFFVCGIFHHMYILHATVDITL